MVVARRRMVAGFVIDDWLNVMSGDRVGATLIDVPGGRFPMGPR